MANTTPLNVTILLDGTQYRKGIADSSVATQQFGQSFQATMRAAQTDSERFLAQLNQQVTQLQFQSDTFGMSAAQIAAFRAQQLGVTAEAAPLVDRMEQLSATLSQAAVATDALAESEEQATARIAAMVAASSAQVEADTAAAYARDAYTASVDASAAAATAAERSQTSLAGAGEAVAASQAAAAEGVTAASQGMSAAANDVALALDRQYVALTATRTQMVAYDAAAAGFTEAEIAELAAISAATEALRAQVALGAEMAAAMETGASAAKGFSGGIAGVTTELGVMGREAASGNIGKLEGSFTRLLSMAGLLSVAFNPITIAVVALGYAMEQGAAQESAMNQALILTGNYAGTTSDGLRQMAQSATDAGGTIGVAVQAMTELAATGRFTSDSIETIGTAATDMQAATGQALDKTIDQFTKLAEDPVKASVALNEQYHYLTTAVYDQIVALEKQGDTLAAGQVAEQAFADALKTRTADILANQGLILRGWQNIKQAVSEALDVMGSLVRTAGPAEVAARLQSAKTARAPIGQWSSDDEAELQDQLKKVADAKDKARAESNSKAQEQAVIGAKQYLATFDKEFATPAQKRLMAINEFLDKTTPLGLTPEQQIDAEANINSKYPDKKAPRGASTASADMTGLASRVASIKAALADQDAATKNSEGVLDDAYRAGTLSMTAYYTQQRDLLAQSATDRLNALSAEESVLASGLANHKLSANQHAQLTKQMIADQQASGKAIQDFFDGVSKSQSKQDLANAKSAAGVKAYTDALADQLSAKQNATDLKVQAVGQGSLESQQSGELNQSAQQYARQQIALANQYQTQIDAAGKDGVALPADYQQKLAALNSAQQISADQIVDSYTRMKAAEGDWLNGANQAWDNFRDNAANIAGQTQKTFTDLFNGLTTSLTTFVTTGKLSFGSLTTAVLGDIVKMELQAAESSLFGSSSGILGSLVGAVAGAVGGVSTSGAAGLANVLPGDGITNLTNITGNFSGVKLAAGGRVSGPGTTTSDSVDAKLSNDEFVVKASVVSQPGMLALLEAINGGATVSGKSHFASGGLVGSPPRMIPPAAGDINVSSVVNIDNGGAGSGSSASAASGAAQLNKLVETGVRTVIAKEMKQGGLIWKMKNGSV